jgi:SAM-dependent methyltransferase
VSDINQDMLDVGIERAMERGLDGLVWSRQNAEELSFESRVFDAYTIAFGIRNVTRIDKALKEAHRVLKFGGRFFCLEFSTTQWPGFKEVYDAYSHKLVPQLGQMIAGTPILPLSDRIDPPFPAHAPVRIHDPRGRFREHPRRTDPGRSGGDPFGLEGLNLLSPRKHIWRLLSWGRILASHGALRGIEQDPHTPAPVAPVPHRPFWRAGS